MARILVVDDDPGFRASLLETLASLGHETAESANSRDALAALGRGGVDAVILDHRLGAETGTDLLRAARERFGASMPPVLVLTAYSDARGTIEAMRLGAFDHLSKPVSRGQIEEFLRRSLSGAPGRARRASADDRLVGESPAMREVHKLIGRAAASDSTVLITGESGTGKEVAARMLHEFSARSLGPFVAVNCAAIPAELLESELFGHVRGAFSGAVGARVGCFEQADRGTLLLDEIGDMPLAMQAKILRVLQERRVARVGESVERELDVRIIAATHRDLQAMVREGSFRHDLFFRLNVLRIELPPLRKRAEDIVPLALLFLDPDGSASRALSDDARRKLLQCEWPGNIRQLRNAMERARVMVPGAVIEAGDLSFIEDPETLGEPGSSGAPAAVPGSSMSSAVASLERDMVRAALEAAGGNRSDAARRLGISRAQLYRKMESLGLGDDA